MPGGSALVAEILPCTTRELEPSNWKDLGPHGETRLLLVRVISTASQLGEGGCRLFGQEGADTRPQQEAKEEARGEGEGTRHPRVRRQPRCRVVRLRSPG